MVRRSHDIPAWRVFGAVLGAFAIAVQLVLSGWLIGLAAAAADQAADQAGLAVICSHDPAATTDDSGAPPAPHSHSQCPACAPQSAHLFAPPPAPASHAVARPLSEPLPVRSDFAATELRLVSPYLSRAPPLSA
jgi:hypothetical protein